MTMQWHDALRPHLLALPSMAKFAIVIAIIVGVPALARRLRVPELIGLLAFGVLWGRMCSASPGRTIQSRSSSQTSGS